MDYQGRGVGDRVLSWPGYESSSLWAWSEQQATTLFPPLLALSCFVAQDGFKLLILLAGLPQWQGLPSIPLYPDSLFSVKSKMEEGK